MKFHAIFLFPIIFSQTILQVNLSNLKTPINILKGLTTKQPDLQIVGGERCPIEEHPYMVSVRRTRDNSHFCGGSLVSRFWVLTAAHCCYNFEYRQFTIVVGVSEITRMERGMQTSLVYQCFEHEAYDTVNFWNDIALLFLEFPIKEDTHVRYVKLPKNSDENLVEICNPSIVMGWGDQQAKDSSHKPLTTPIWKEDPFLQCVKLPVVEQSYCEEWYNEDFPDTTLCAFSPGRDACQGDSGGPLMCNDVQYGIVSYGIGCAYDGYPGVYTRVDKFTNFIHRTIRRNCTVALCLNGLLLSFLLFFCLLPSLYLYFIC